MHSKSVAFAIGMLVTATAAPAQQPTGNTVAKEQRAGANQTYCIEFKDDTGSHVSRRECRTRKDWKSRGVDVDEVQGS